MLFGLDVSGYPPVAIPSTQWMFIDRFHPGVMHQTTRLGSQLVQLGKRLNVLSHSLNYTSYCIIYIHTL